MRSVADGLRRGGRLLSCWLKIAKSTEECEHVRDSYLFGGMVGGSRRSAKHNRFDSARRLRMKRTGRRLR